MRYWTAEIGRADALLFGRVTYEDDFRACLVAAGVELVELHTMSATRHLSHRLAIARAGTGDRGRAAA